jgi:hypothetical protein
MLIVDLFEYTSGSIPKYYSIEDGYQYAASKKSKVFHNILPVNMLQPLKRKPSFIFKAWKKPKLLEEEGVRLVNRMNKFINYKTKSG